ALNNVSANALNNESPSASPFAQNGIDVYYTKNAFPTEISTILNVNYYDEYPVGSPSQPSQIQNQTTLAPVATTIVSNGLSSVRSTKTLPTASYTKNIENDSWSSAFIWYDTSGRVVGTYGKNHLGGFTRTEAILDFSGETKESYTYHSKDTSSAQVTIKNRYTYSPQNFLLKHYQQIGSNM
ncbi:RHS repeat-associated core domain-containing protein, partial [Chryseobacterium sp. SIMBA_029]